MFEFSESRGKFYPGFCEAKETRMIRVDEIREGCRMAAEFGYYPLVTNSLSRKFRKLLEMGKNPNPARTNRTRTQVLPRTEMNPNPKVKKCARTEPNRTP